MQYVKIGTYNSRKVH